MGQGVFKWEVARKVAQFLVLGSGLTELEILSQQMFLRRLVAAALVFLVGVSVTLALGAVGYRVFCAAGNCAGAPSFPESAYVQGLLGASFGGFAAYAGAVYFSRVDEARRNTTDVIMRVHSIEMIENRRKAQLYLERYFGLNDQYKYKRSDEQESTYNLSNLFFDGSVRFNGKDPIEERIEGLQSLRAGVAMIEMIGDLHQIGAIDSRIVANAIGDMLETWLRVLKPFMIDTQNAQSDVSPHWKGVIAGYHAAGELLKLREEQGDTHGAAVTVSS